MSDTVNTLINSALTLDNEEEAMAFFRKARKIAAKEDVVLPRRVRRAAAIDVATQDAVRKRELDEAIREVEKTVAALRRENQELIVENNDLRSAALKEINHDVEVISLKSRLRTAYQTVAILTSALVVAVAVLVVT
jgi:hypothetical protein